MAFKIAVEKSTSINFGMPLYCVENRKKVVYPLSAMINLLAILVEMRLIYCDNRRDGLNSRDLKLTGDEVNIFFFRKSTGSITHFVIHRSRNRKVKFKSKGNT